MWDMGSGNINGMYKIDFFLYCLVYVTIFVSVSLELHYAVTVH